MESKQWIKRATKHKGALHKNLGIPEGTKISKEKLEAAAEKSGKIGREARLALTLNKMHRSKVHP